MIKSRTNLARIDIARRTTIWMIHSTDSGITSKGLWMFRRPEERAAEEGRG